MRGTELVGDGDLDVLLGPPNEDSALELFLKAGVCVFHDVLSVELMDDMNKVVQDECDRIDEQLLSRNVDLESPFRFNEVCRRRHGRYDLKLHRGGDRIDACGNSVPFLHPTLWAEFPLLGFLDQVLGSGAVELWRGVVNSRPGSHDQGWHRDGEHLFEHVHLPPHCVTVFFPLIDITEESGPTEFYPGSHIVERSHHYTAVEEDGGCHLPTCRPLSNRGSLVVCDYRTVHRGTANTGLASRALMYIVFAKPWFKDHANFPVDNPLFLPCDPTDAANTVPVPA